MSPILSEHACLRSAQRNLSYDEILFIVEHGKRLHGAGGIFCRMYRNRLPDDLPANHPYQRLVGSTVLLCPCGHYVITLYREDGAFRKDARKPKYDHRSGSRKCQHCGHHSDTGKIA